MSNPYALTDVQPGDLCADFTDPSHLWGWFTANHVKCVFPYTPRIGGGGWGSGKQASCSPDNLAKYLAAGISIVPQWEGSQDDILLGGDKGYRNGEWTAKFWQDQGYPAGGIIVVSNDTDISPADLSQAVEYDKGFETAVRVAGFTFGIYGDVDILLAFPGCDLGIVPAATIWSKPRPHPRAPLSEQQAWAVSTGAPIHVQQGFQPPGFTVDPDLTLRGFKAAGPVPVPVIPTPVPPVPPVPPFNPPWTPTLDPTTWLVKGSTGAHVAILQTKLQAKGFYLHLPVDGRFGQRTLDAVLGFQNHMHLKRDGKVGPATWKALG